MAGPQIGAWPDKSIGVGDNDPRPLIVEPEAPLRLDRNFDREVRLRRRRMRHGQNQNDVLTVLIFRHEHDCAWPILVAVFLTSGGGFAPKKRITDDKARNRCGQRRHAYFIS